MTPIRLFLIIMIGFGSLMKQGQACAENNIATNRSDAKTFVIAAHEWPPFSSAEAKYFGIAPHIVTDILQSQAIEVKYRFSPWKIALDGVITSEYDGAIVWVTEDLRLESFLVSDPLLEYRSALFYRKSTPDPKMLDDLIGHRMGVNPYFIYDAQSYPLLKKGAIASVEGKSDIEHFRYLLDGKTDFYFSPITTDTPLQHKTLTHDEQNALTYNSNLFKFPAPHLVVNRNREGSAEFIRKFNLRLNRMKNDGTVNRYILLNTRETL